MKTRLILWLAFAHISIFINNPAYGEDKSLLVGEVNVIDIPFDIRSILNGSDTVVNLNVDGPRSIIVTGMEPGRTNLIALGANRERIDLAITVSSDQRDLVYLHEGAAATVTYKCEQRCLREQSESGGGEPSLEAAVPASGDASTAK